MRIIYILHAEITGRKDIHALQAKTGKHLHGPSTQSPHGRQLLEHFLVAGSNQHLGAQFTRRKLLREPLDVFGLSTG